MVMAQILHENIKNHCNCKEIYRCTLCAKVESPRIDLSTSKFEKDIKAFL